MKDIIDIDRIFSNDRLIDRALRAGVRAALEQHKRLGLPVVDCRDGRIVMVPPDEIDRVIRRRKASNRPSRKR